MDDFLFLRPAWLLLVLLAPLLVWLWRHGNRGASGWETVISRTLLNPLMPGNRKSPESRKGRGWWPAVLVIASAIALAGPSWRQAPNPLGKPADSLVVALDMSLSMLAQDVSPDRLTRAKQKIRDLLPERADAFTGLVAYAGDAHVVTPLTDDAGAVENLLPALDPFIMPAMGSRPDLAVAEAADLLKQGGRGQGSILLITDGVDERHHEAIQSVLEESGYQLQILAVGTPQGSPIPLPERGFLRDNGRLVTPSLDMDALEALADETGARIERLTLSGADLEQLGVTDTVDALDGATQIERQLSLRVDDGYWLVWLLLPLALIAWRRGGLALLVLGFALPTPQTAYAQNGQPSPAQIQTENTPAPNTAASDPEGWQEAARNIWEDLWQRPDQQGAELFPNNPAAAAEEFENPAWRGSALYRAGEYDAAASQFARSDSTEADYNRGNALARAGELEKALEAYNEVLRSTPDHTDAQANKALVEELLKQQQSQQQKQQQSDSEKPGEDKNQQSGEQNGDSDSQQPPTEDGSDGNQQSQQDGQVPGAEDSQPSEGDGDKPPEEQAEDSSASGGQSPQPAEGEAGLLSDPEAQNERSREQWMRRVPDDPGGLLRRKFLYQYQQNNQYEQNNSNPEESEPW